MRLPVERIKESMLHPDPEVRVAAGFYFYRSFSLDPSIMPLAIQAVERYGRDAFVAPTFLENLRQTDATVAWLIQEIERVGAFTDEPEDRYPSALITALCHADPAVLKQHEAAIQAMGELDEAAKAVIADRIYVNSFTPDALWGELSDCCDSQDDPTAIAPEDFEYAYALVAAMSRHPDQLADKVLAVLADKENVYDEWWESLLVRLAGEMRLEAAIPHLVDRLEESGDWLGDETQEALVRIGTDAVVQELAERYAADDWGYRMEAALLLQDIHSDLSVQACLDLLEQEAEEELRGRLLQAILMNFSTAGIEPARQHVLNTPKSPDVLEVRTALLVACKMMGETFPEFEAWSEDSKHDVEFRQRWYKEHDLNPDFDDDDFSDVFENDGFEDEGVEDVGDDDFSDDEGPITIVRRGERIGRNDPCPCGSGKKYKKCCYGKGQVLEETDESHSFVMGSVRGGKSASKFPIGTIALYGPDDKTTTKIVAGVIKREEAEAIIERWVGTNITNSPKAQRQMKDFFDRHKVKSIVVAEANIGCPHEEGSDFPMGQDCPFCPFWAGKQGSNRRD